MLNWLKKYFIPHEANDHKPHILRLEKALVILGGVLVLEVVFLGAYIVGPRSGFLASILSSVLVDGTNLNRVEYSVAPLHANTLLAEAAKLKAEDMAAKSYFAHTSPEGITPWYWLGKVGYNFAYAGENLAVNFTDSQDALNAWMNSPAHRANILNRNFTEIGIATAEGLYQGKTVTYIVQFFGSPAAASSPAAIPVKTAVSAPTSTPGAPIVATTTETFAMARGAVEGVSVPATPVQQTGFLARLLSAPRNVLNFIYIIVGTIVLLGLLLTVFIRIRVQHPPLIVNGVVLILVIASIIALNQYLLLTHSRVL